MATALSSRLVDQPPEAVGVDVVRDETEVELGRIELSLQAAEELDFADRLRKRQAVALYPPQPKKRISLALSAAGKASGLAQPRCDQQSTA